MATDEDRGWTPAIPGSYPQGLARSPGQFEDPTAVSLRAPRRAYEAVAKEARSPDPRRPLRSGRASSLRTTTCHPVPCQPTDDPGGAQRARVAGTRRHPIEQRHVVAEREADATTPRLRRATTAPPRCIETRLVVEVACRSARGQARSRSPGGARGRRAWRSRRSSGSPSPSSCRRDRRRLSPSSRRPHREQLPVPGPRADLANDGAGRCSRHCCNAAGRQRTRAGPPPSTAPSTRRSASATPELAAFAMERHLRALCRRALRGRPVRRASSALLRLMFTRHRRPPAPDDRHRILAAPGLVHREPRMDARRPTGSYDMRVSGALHGRDRRSSQRPGAGRARHPHERRLPPRRRPRRASPGCRTPSSGTTGSPRAELPGGATEYDTRNAPRRGATPAGGCPLSSVRSTRRPARVRQALAHRAGAHRPPVSSSGPSRPSSSRTCSSCAPTGTAEQARPDVGHGDRDEPRAAASSPTPAAR